jgi:hypothetical protein
MPLTPEFRFFVDLLIRVQKMLVSIRKHSSNDGFASTYVKENYLEELAHVGNGTG